MNRPRRSLWDTFRRCLRDGDWMLAGAAAHRGLRLRRGLPLDRPVFATLAVTYRCNYRCNMCDLPLRARRDPSTEELLARVAELHRRGALALGITGGEPLLHPGLFEVVAEATRRGMWVHLNSNGSRLTADRVPEILASGIRSLNLSLDGAIDATHDELRKVPGSFEQILATTRAVLEQRQPAGPRLGWVMALSRANLGELVELVALGKRLGVDGVGFLPHHEFYAHEPTLTAVEEARLRRDLAAVESDVDNSPAYLQGIPGFLAGDAQPLECSAPDSHLAVDPDGNSYPCVPLMTLERSGVPLSGPDLGRGERDHRPSKPQPTAADREEVCRRCWWNCHRELDLSTGRL